MIYYTRTRAFLGSRWGTRATPRRGNSGGRPPVDIYPCKPFGPNDYIYLMPVNQDHWDGLCAAMDRGDMLIDPRFETMPARIQNRDALYEEIRDWTAKRTKYEAMETIAEAGVPCSACLDTAELHHDKHLKARGFIHEMELPVHGKVPMLGFAPRLSDSEVEMTPPPRLGQHTDELLQPSEGWNYEELDRREPFADNALPPPEPIATDPQSALLEYEPASAVADETDEPVTDAALEATEQSLSTDPPHEADPSDSTSEAETTVGDLDDTPEVESSSANAISKIFGKLRLRRRDRSDSNGSVSQAAAETSSEETQSDWGSGTVEEWQLEPLVAPARTAGGR